MMKKILMLMIALVTCLSWATASAQNVYVSMPNVSGAPGTEVTIPVYATNDADMTAFQIYFSTNLGVGFTDVEFGDRVDAIANAFVNPNTNGIFCVSFVGSNVVTLEAGAGKIVDIYLTIPSDADPGTYTLTLSGMAFVVVNNEAVIEPGDVTATLTVTGSGNSNYDFVVDGIFYKITGNNTVGVTCEELGNATYAGDVTIPENVYYNGKVYTVTSIGAGSFYNSLFLESVTIPETVTTIYTAAFWNCENMESIIIPSSVTTIAYMAFAGCTSLSEVTCLATTPPTINEYTFDSDTYYARLFVPKWCEDVYKAADNWSNFSYVTELAYDFEVGGFYYNIDYYSGDPQAQVEVTYRDEYRLASYSGDVTIPKSVTWQGVTYQVTAIGYQAFCYCPELISVTIPNTVKVIDSHAFSQSENLRGVTIPNSVTAIGAFAFRDCKAMPMITLPNSLVSIGEQAFRNCINLTSMTIPSSVTSIGDYAFLWCEPLTTLTIPASVTSIGIGITSGCTGLTSLKVASGNPAYDSRNNCNAIIEKANNTLISGCNETVFPSSVTTIGEGAFSYLSFTSMNIPNSVTSIADFAFYGCSRMKSVTIPNTVTSIGKGAFMLTGLTSVTIPASVTTIRNSAFYGCDELTRVAIPASVTSIEDYAFSNCEALTSVTCMAPTPPTVGFSFGNNTYSGATLYVPRGRKSAYQAANSWKNFTNIQELNCDFEVSGIYYRITGSNTVEVTYRDSNYDSYSGIVNIPSTVSHGGTTYRVTEIGGYAFYHSMGLTRVTIPNSVTKIGADAFYSCQKLANVTIPQSVTYIESGAFGCCIEFTSITIPKNVTYIGEYVFDRCIRLTSMTVESGNSVFDSRNNCNAIIKTATNSLLYGCTTTVIPNTVTSIAKSAFCGNYNLTSVSIPNSVTEIGVDAFASCIALTSVTIPNSVTNIMFGAFRNCSKLGSVTIGSGVTDISTGVFTGCPVLMSVTCLAVTPPALGENAFENNTYANATLGVFSGVVNAYKAADGWKNFTHVVGIGATPGDLNGDNSIDVADVTALIAMVMGNVPLDVTVADINHDGNVDVADVTALIAHVLNGTSLTK